MNLKDFFWPTMEKMKIFFGMLVVAVIILLFLSTTVMASFALSISEYGCSNVLSALGWILVVIPILVIYWIASCVLSHFVDKLGKLKIIPIIFFGIVLFILSTSIFVYFGSWAKENNIFMEERCHGSGAGIVKNLLNEALKNPGSLRTSQQNSILYSGSNITPSAITSGIGITRDQVCILKGEQENTSGFEFRGQSLFYNGSNINISLEVLCNNSSVLAANLEEIYSTQFDHALVESSANVSCGQGCLSGSGTCCAVILNQAK
ncbi:MAG: hypothetical protein Q7K42_05590 [Candidatus Diapherotrites archaeon]|nr:hypothetical protein [Candidatus Diapherotrites archaeon]